MQKTRKRKFTFICASTVVSSFNTLHTSLLVVLHRALEKEESGNKCRDMTHYVFINFFLNYYLQVYVHSQTAKVVAAIQNHLSMHHIAKKKHMLPIA